MNGLERFSKYLTFSRLVIVVCTHSYYHPFAAPQLERNRSFQLQSAARVVYQAAVFPSSPLVLAFASFAKHCCIRDYLYQVSGDGVNSSPIPPLI